MGCRPRRRQAQSSQGGSPCSCWPGPRRRCRRRRSCTPWSPQCWSTCRGRKGCSCPGPPRCSSCPWGCNTERDRGWNRHWSAQPAMQAHRHTTSHGAAIATAVPTDSPKLTRGWTHRRQWCSQKCQRGQPRRWCQAGCCCNRRGRQCTPHCPHWRSGCHGGRPGKRWRQRWGDRSAAGTAGTGCGQRCWAGWQRSR